MRAELVVFVYRSAGHWCSRVVCTSVLTWELILLVRGHPTQNYYAMPRFFRNRLDCEGLSDKILASHCEPAALVIHQEITERLEIMITEREILLLRKDEGEEDTDDPKYPRFPEIEQLLRGSIFQPIHRVVSGHPKKFVQTESSLVSRPRQIFPLGVNWNDLFCDFMY